MTELIISNEEIHEITKIVKSHKRIRFTGNRVARASEGVIRAGQDF